MAQLYEANPRFRFVQVRLCYIRNGPPTFKHPVLQINLQENILKSAIVSLSKYSIRGSLPKWQHATYLHSSQNMEMLRKPLGFENKHLGFVYLVDENVKIRWAACGQAKKEETLALMQCTGILLDRLKAEEKEGLQGSGAADPPPQS